MDNDFCKVTHIPYLISPDVDECKNNPCKNGGSCTNLKGGYKCDCTKGYTGKHCDQGKMSLANTPHLYYYDEIGCMVTMNVRKIISLFWSGLLDVNAHMMKSYSVGAR